MDVLQKKDGLQAGEFSLHNPPVMCSEMSGLAPLNGTLFSAPLRGISTFTKHFSPENTQKSVSKVLMPDLQTQSLKEPHQAKTIPEGVDHVKGQCENNQGQIFVPVLSIDAVVVVGRFQGFFLDIS
jgi:hypothetical protein